MRLAWVAAALMAAAEAGAVCSMPDATAAAEFRAFRLNLKNAEARAPLVDCLKREIARSKDSAQTARLQLAAATLLQDSGESKAARAMLEPAMSVLERTAQPHELAIAERQLGTIDDDLGNAASAEAHLRRALALFTKDNVPRHAEVGYTLNLLGTVAYSQDHYDEAEGLFAQTLAAADAGNDDALRAIAHGSAANVAYFRSDYRKAIREYEAAARILSKLYGEQSVRVAQTYNNMGSAYFELGMYAEAQDWLNRSLTLKQQLFGPDSAIVASTLSNLGEVMVERGRTDEARGMYDRARQIFVRAQGERNPMALSAANELAELELKSGNVQRARELLEHVVAAREQTPGPDSSDVAVSLNPLGAAYQSLGRTTEARGALERSVLIANTAGGSDLRAESSLAYARFLAEQQQLGAAVLFGKIAVNVLQEMRNEVSQLGRPVERSFLAAREPTYRALADWLITLGRIPEASQVLDMLKEEEYVDFIRTRAARDDLGSTRAQFTTQEAAFSGQLTAAAAAFKQARSPENRAGFQTVLGRIGTQRVLDTSSAPTSRDTSVDGATLGADAALVRYVVSPDRLRIVATTRKREWQRDASVPAATLNRQIFELREDLQNRRSDPRPRASELYRELIGPIEADLRAGQIRRLLIVEDGTLRYLPFAALFDGKRWLAESYELQVATPAARSKTAATVRDLDRVAAFGVTQPAPGLAALTGVAAELDRIVKASDTDKYGVLPGFVALDDAFSAARLQAALAEGFPAIHIATHFVFRPGPVDDSYLLLGQGARLTLAELRSSQYSLRNVDLLTLSACETAVGQPDANGREFESFGVLAQRQGARTVLATLWPVTDLSTATFMSRFYRERQKSGDGKPDTAAALRRTQVSFLQGGVWRHPFYWAPYIVMGGS